MGAFEEIQKAQKAWAEGKGKQFHPSPRYEYYLDSIDANLRQCLSAEALEGYANGDGSELRDARGKPAKMKALHSSGALAANVFDYWTDKDTTPLLSALAVSNLSAKSLDFETKLPTAVSKERNSKPPNLDVAITLDSRHIIAIEGKFTEWMPRSTVGKSSFRRKPRDGDRQTWDDSAYFPTLHGRWDKVGLTKCQEFASELNHIQKRRHSGERRLHFPFEHLDAAQLLKHALGLGTQRGSSEFDPYYDNFSLYYLYYDWPGDESKKHKEEIKTFSNCVDHELHFKALSYQELYRRLSESPQASEHTDYLTYLGERYFSGKGAPRD